MEGMGFNRDLPSSLKGVQRDVWIYNSIRKKDHDPPEPTGVWDHLQPGHGDGFTTNGETSFPSERFGIELTFAQTMKQLRLDPIALFKYAKGGSSIHSKIPEEWGTWDPEFMDGTGVNQWDHFQYHYRRAMRTLPDDIQQVTPKGILWLQGESDASFTAEIARMYPKHLARLIRHMRALAGDPELPVVICRISEHRYPEHSRRILPWSDIIQNAQEQFVQMDPNATLVLPPEGHGWLDDWHYDSQTYLELGSRMAEAMDHCLSSFNRR